MYFYVVIIWKWILVENWYTTRNMHINMTRKLQTAYRLLYNCNTHNTQWNYLITTYTHVCMYVCISTIDFWMTWQVLLLTSNSTLQTFILNNLDIIPFQSRIGKFLVWFKDPKDCWGVQINVRQTFRVCLKILYEVTIT